MINNFKELFAGYDCKIVIEPSLRSRSKELIEIANLGNRQTLIICDQATHAALGERITKELNARLLLLDGKPHANEATVNFIRSHPADALIAVGSGTISDLCKYASFLDKKEYIVFPTASSMNGYFSANASITTGGHKQSLPAHLPKGIFCDLGVIATAPKRLTLSGLGDSLCRPTAQADWLLSHLLFLTPYISEPFTMSAPYEHELFSHADKLAAGDIRVIELLIKNLLISGLGMVMAGGSYPASQGEHLIAHTMEMKYGGMLPDSYHGEQIGVTTLIMAGIQQQILSKELCLRMPDNWKADIAAYFDKALVESISKSYAEKLRLYDKYDEINERLSKEDKAIRDRIKAVALPETALRNILQKAGAYYSEDNLGWNKQNSRQSTTYAKYIRNRFTFLDL